MAATTKQWTARNLQKLCAQRDPVPTFVPEYKVETLACSRAPAPCPNSSVGTRKKGVFTSVPSEYRNRAPCPGTKCERCLILLAAPEAFRYSSGDGAKKSGRKNHSKEFSDFFLRSGTK